MFERVIDRFRKRHARPPVPAPLTGSAIYAYVRRLDERDRERLDDEIRDRGLSFGDLAVDGVFGGGITFATRRTGRRTTDEVPLDAITDALRAIVDEQRLAGVSVDSGGGPSKEAYLLLSDAAPASLRGACVSGFSGGRSFQHRRFLEVRQHGGHALEITAYSPEATDVVLLLAQRLGFETGPAAYANESDVPLARIVDYACHWKDPATGKHYVEAKFDPAEVKSEVYVGGGWNKCREDGGRKVLVLAGECRPRLKLNNVFVETREVGGPTPSMEATRAYIRERVKRTCGVDGCGRKVVNDIRVTRAEMSDGFGTSSFGSTYGACDLPEHVEKKRAAAEGIRVTVSPATKENW